MSKREKKEKRSRFANLSLSVTFWLALSAVFVIFFLVIIGHEITRFNNYTSQVQLLQERINNERRRGQQLDAELHRDNLDEYIERTARERLGLVMPDEIVFIRDRD